MQFAPPIPAGPDEEASDALTKSELIARLAIVFRQLPPRDSEMAVRAILDEMARSLGQGKRIEIRGFGSFALSYRPPRMGRNPKSGAVVQVPGKRVPHFKPGKQLRERVDALPQADSPTGKPIS